MINTEMLARRFKDLLDEKINNMRNGSVTCVVHYKDGKPLNVEILTKEHFNNKNIDK